MSISIVDLYST